MVWSGNTVDFIPINRYLLKNSSHNKIQITKARSLFLISVLFNYLNKILFINRILTIAVKLCLKHCIYQTIKHRQVLNYMTNVKIFKYEFYYSAFWLIKISSKCSFTLLHCKFAYTIINTIKMV